MRTLLILALLLFTTPASAQILVGTIWADLKRDGAIWNPGAWDGGPLKFTWGTYAEITPHYPSAGPPPTDALTITSESWVNGSNCLGPGYPIPLPAQCAVIDLTFYESTVLFAQTTITDWTSFEEFRAWRIDRAVDARGSATFADGRVELLEGHGVSTREYYGTWRADLVQSPEPGTLLLFATGLLAVFAGHRARRLLRAAA